MEKVIIQIVIIIILTSCTKNVDKDEIFLKINNDILKKEMLNYYSQTKKEYNDNSFVIALHYIQVNDTINKFIISTIDFCDFVSENYPYHFIFKVEDKKFYFFVEGLNNDYDTAHVFFKTDKSTLNIFAKENFPEQYKDKLNGVSIVPFPSGPKSCELIFNREKLLKKEMKIIY